MLTAATAATSHAAGTSTEARRAPIALDAVTPESARAALLPATAAVAHLPAITLPADTLAGAIRGDLLDIDATATAVSAFDDAGDLVGILRRHESGRHRLKPNFFGLG